MSGGYTLRDATAADIGVLARNRARMFADMAVLAGTPHDPAVIDRLEGESADVFAIGFGTEHVGWVAEAPDGSVAASAMVSVQPWLPTPRYPEQARPYYHSVYTEPAHRGHGLARRLTELAIGWSREAGFTTMALHASDEGRPIYEKLGFTHASEMVLPLR